MKKIIITLLMSILLCHSPVAISMKDERENAMDEGSDDFMSIAQCLVYNDRDIVRIKQFHETWNLCYKKPLLFSVFDKQELECEKNCFIYPIDWALVNNEIDFAIWLIKCHHVDVASSMSRFHYSKFHYLVDGMLGIHDNHFMEKNITKNDEGKGVDPACYLELMKLLVVNKAQINDLDCYGNTALSAYNIKVKKRCCNLNIFKLFFDHGGQLAGKQENVDQEIKQRNITERIVQGGDPYEIALLFKMRLEAQSPFEGIDYRNQLYHAKKKYDFYFKCLSILNKRLGPYKMPKPLMHAISKSAASDDEKKFDIQQSLCPRNERSVCYSEPNSLTPLEFFMQHKAIDCGTKILMILNPDFWNNPLEYCYKAVNEILNQNKKK